MAIFYRYAFENNLPKDNENRINPNTGLPFSLFHIYAESESEARRFFKWEFDHEAGELLYRERW